MDINGEHGFADEGPPSDFELEEDTQILATLLKHNAYTTELKDLIQRALHHPDLNLHSVGMRALQWKTQGKMLFLQSKWSPLQRKEQPGRSYHLILMHIISYDIIHDITVIMYNIMNDDVFLQRAGLFGGSALCRKNPNPL